MVRIFSIILANILINSIVSLSQNYFQQQTDYDIDATLNITDHTLSCNMSIVYTNNSSDTLHYIYFHLWPNAYKNNSTAFAKQQIELGYTDFYYSQPHQKGYIENLQFKINNKQATFETDAENIDIGKLILDTPLLPGEKITISTPFLVKIPYYFSRLGHINNDYYITQWYPKPAVYDNKDWHAMPYLDQGEFYSEFGKFNVNIFVPDSFVVAATGNLLSTKLLNDTIIDGTSLNSYKKLSYTENKIHDFAWFASKDFIFREKTLTLPVSKKTVKLEAYFHTTILKHEEKAIDYLEDAILFYSEKYGEYPYKTCKIVLSDCDGGMEYPTISLIGPMYNAFALEELIVHEVGHNWFYEILGFNERETPWLDEGLNTFSELRYIYNKYPNQKYSGEFSGLGARFLGLNQLSYSDFYNLEYLSLANERKDLPANLHSNKYDEDNYYAITYGKSALSTYQLMNLIGINKFDSLAKSFYKNWKFRHPSATDFENHFRSNTTQNLDWYFNDIISDKQYTDYKIKRIKGDSILITNRFNSKSPVFLSGIKYDQPVFRKTITNPNKKQWIQIPSLELNEVIIDKERFSLDLNHNNNEISTKGTFKKVNPIKLKLYGTYDIPGYNQINFAPFMGWNNYDSYMPGIYIYNSLYPSPNFEYSILPMYGIKSNEFVGNYEISANSYFNNNIIQKINWNASYTRFSLLNEQVPYNKLKTQVKTYFNYTNKFEEYFTASWYYLNIPQDITIKEYTLKSIFRAEYHMVINNTIKPQHYNINIEAGKGFVKSHLELNNSWLFSNKYGFHTRLFIGSFLYEQDDYYGNYNFHLSGMNGLQDYTYEEYFLGRAKTYGNGTLIDKQFLKNEGGFTTYTYLGQTNKWLASLNLSASLPILIPIKPYLNIAVFDQTGDYSYNDKVFWETGFEVSIIPDIFEIYFPAVMSGELKKQSDFISDNYWDKVRFTLNINKLNPLKSIKN